MPEGRPPERKTGLGTADRAQYSGVRSSRGIYLCNLVLRAMKTRVDRAIWPLGTCVFGATAATVFRLLRKENHNLNRMSPISL